MFASCTRTWLARGDGAPLNIGLGSQAKILKLEHVFVWAEICFLWITTAPYTVQETSDKLTTAIKLSAICEGLGLQLAEVKYILKREKPSFSMFCLSVNLSPVSLGAAEGRIVLPQGII